MSRLKLNNQVQAHFEKSNMFAKSRVKDGCIDVTHESEF